MILRLQRPAKKLSAMPVVGDGVNAASTEGGTTHALTFKSLPDDFAGLSSRFHTFIAQFPDQTISPVAEGAGIV